MPKLTKRIVDAAEPREKDYVIWDDDLPGFGLRVFVSGKRSYLIQYRSAGRSRRYTIGLHGVWTPESARQEAKVQLGRVAAGDNPAEERQLDHKALTIKELCALYVKDLNAGLILGKGGRPKKPTTIGTDIGRIDRHIVPLLGTRRVKDLTKADINKVLKDVMAGKTRVSVKTKKLRGRAIVRGGAGTATRTVGLLGGILTYAVEYGIIAVNPAHGLRKPKDNVRTRRLTEAEHRTLGEMLREAEKEEKYATTVDIIRQIALTGCRRSEMIGLMWTEADTDGSCLRLIDSKEGTSIRPTGPPVVEFLEARRKTSSGTYVFPGHGDDNAFGSFPNHWEQLFKKSPLSDVTPHVLRHSFASIGNDLGFTEVTIAALVGHAKGSVTSKYIHTLDTALVMAADIIAGYIEGLLDGKEFKQTAYALDRDSRKAALARFLRKASAKNPPIRAKKARYYEDGRFHERIVVAPVPARPKEARPDDWSARPLPPRPPAPVVGDGEDADDEDPKNADRRKQPELSQGTVEKKEPIENEFALDPVDDMEEEEDAPRIGRMNDLMQGLAQQASLDPGDDLSM